MILVVTAFVAAGGAERVTLDLMEALSAEARFVLAYTEPSANDWEARFRSVCSAVRRVSNKQALADFAAEEGAAAAVVSSSGLGYEALPLLKAEGLRLFDIVHNTTPTGWLQESVHQDRNIETHLAAGRLQREKLAAAGVAESKIVLSPNGVDAEGRFGPDAYRDGLADLRVRFGVEPGRPVVCWIGRLSTEKDPLLFIDVIDRLRDSHPQIRALMLGDGPERVAVETTVRERGLSSIVETLGVRDDTPEALAVSDVFALPSRVEGSPITLLEAMSMRLATVAADVGSVSEALEDGRNGRLIRDRNAASFAAVIGELLDDPEARRAMGAAARSTVLERFNMRDCAALYRSALSKVLGSEV